MRVEIAHDLLAKSVFEKGSKGDKAFLRAQRLVKERYASFKDTKTFLDPKELDFIEPYLADLGYTLTAQETDFIRRSRSMAKLKQFIWIIIVSVLLVITLIWLIFTIQQKNSIEAERTRNKLSVQSNELTAYSLRLIEEDPTSAYQLAQEAYRFFPDNSSSRVILNLINTDKTPFYKTVLIHDFPVLNAIYSPNDKLIATSGKDSIVYLWDAQGNKMSQLKAHVEPVYGLAFSPDSRRLMTCSDDNLAILWDVSNPTQPKVIRAFDGHEEDVNVAAFSDDGKHIATAGRDAKILLWDTLGNVLRTFKGHEGTIYDIAFSHHSDSTELLLASASRDNTAKVWSVFGKDSLRYTLPSDMRVTSVDFSPKTKDLVAVGSHDLTIKLWNLKEFQKTKDPKYSGDKYRPAELKGHTGGIRSVQFSKNGSSILSSATDKKAIIWDLEKLAVRRVFQGHVKELFKARYSNDEHFVLTAGFDKTVKIWDINLVLNTQPLFEQQLHAPKRSHKVLVSPDLKWIATGGWDGNIRILDYATRQVVFSQSLNNDVEGIAFSPDSKKLAAVSGKKIFLFSVKDNGSLAIIPVVFPEKHTRTIKAVSFSPKGEYLLTAGRDATAILWNMKGQVISTSVGHKADILGVAFSPQKPVFATASWDSTVIIWDFIGQPMDTLVGHRHFVYDVKFSPNGKQILTGSADFTARIWRASDGKLTDSIEAHAGTVFSVDFSKDGKTILTAGGDGYFRAWDTQGGVPLDAIEAQKSDIYNAIFSPHNKEILVVGGDGYLRIFQNNAWMRFQNMAPLTPQRIERLGISIPPDMLERISSTNSLYQQKKKKVGRSN